MASTEHHAEEHERKDQVEDPGQRRTRQKIADVFELAHARDRLAGASRLEIGERQCQQMAEEPSAQFGVDAVGGMGKR